MEVDCLFECGSKKKDAIAWEHFQISQMFQSLLISIVQSSTSLVSL